MRRIVIDTNCLVAILPSQSPYHRVWTEFLANKLEICVSTEILMEYEEILSEKTTPYFADSIIQTLLNKENLVRVSPVWRFNLIYQDPMITSSLIVRYVGEQSTLCRMTSTSEYFVM